MGPVPIPAPAASGALINADRVALIVVVISAVFAVIAMLRRDRSITVTPAGYRRGPDATELDSISPAQRLA